MILFIYLNLYIKKKTEKNLITKKKKKILRWATSFPSPLEKQNKSSARHLRNLRNWGIKREREERRRWRRDPIDPQPFHPTITQTQLTHHCWPVTTSIHYPLHSKTTVQTTNPPQMTSKHHKVSNRVNWSNTQHKKRPFFFYLTLGSNQVP